MVAAEAAAVAVDTEVPEVAVVGMIDKELDNLDRKRLSTRSLDMVASEHSCEAVVAASLGWRDEVVACRKRSCLVEARTAVDADSACSEVVMCHILDVQSEAGRSKASSEDVVEECALG